MTMFHSSGAGHPAAFACTFAAAAKRRKCDAGAAGLQDVSVKRALEKKVVAAVFTMDYNGLLWISMDITMDCHGVPSFLTK